MLVDDFGYEDLLFMLAERDIDIQLDEKRVEIFKRQNLLNYFCTDSNEAKITLVNHIDRNTVKKRLIDEKIISIEFTSDDRKSLNGLRFIKFSIHPTMADISFIASLAAPLHVYCIGHSIDFPFDLSYLCRYDEKNDRNKSKNTTQKSK